MTLKKQTSLPTWLDEQGTAVPGNRITPIEKMKEKYAFQLAKQALGINKELSDFKKKITLVCQDVFTEVMNEKERARATKGNFVWYNFDGSIKVEININDNIEFDGLLIEKAKQKLLDLVSESISPDKIMIKELVLSAFQTSKGKLDTNKILGLKKHASRIKDKRYAEAMDFIDLSIRRPNSKTYFRVWVRDDAGQYQNIDLNFSSITV